MRLHGAKGRGENLNHLECKITLRKVHIKKEGLFRYQVVQLLFPSPSLILSRKFYRN